MEWLDSIPEGLRGFAVIGFVLAGAAYAIWSSRRGVREGEPKMQEFAVAGQLADMGPVRELIEGVGLLIQQMVRTNLVLEDIARTISADIAERKKERDDRDREEEYARIARRAAEEVQREAEDEKEDRARGRAPRKSGT